MLTRCPNCATAFRVRPEQLRIRHGRVRCGHCSEPFNALESLLEDEAAQALSDQAPKPPAEGPGEPTARETDRAEPGPGAKAGGEAPADARTPGEESSAPLFVLEETLGEIPEQLALPDIDEPVPELYIEGLSRDPAASAAPDWSLPELSTRGQPPAATASATPEFDADVEQSIREMSSRLDFELPASAPAVQAAEPVAVEASNESARAVSPGDASPAAPPRAPEPSPMPSADPWNRERIADDRPAAGIAPDSDAPPSPPPRPAPDPVASAATFPDEPEYPFRIAPPAPPRSALWGLGIGTLTMLLAAQASILFRNAIVQIAPETQPFYIDLCEKLGCAMPLPREAGFIAIEATDLHPEPARPDTFVLRTTIQNRAAFRQAYPHLELTLTDARDAALARRVLAPAEWRPKQAPTEGFPPRSVLDVSVPFEAPGLKAVGYRVYAFYP